MTLGEKIKLYFAWKKFMGLMATAWARYLAGKTDQPPTVEEVKSKSNVKSRYRRRK